MRAKLFTLPESTLAHLVRLEAQAMIPILASSGIKVTEEDIKAEIYKDQNQEVVIVFRNENPIAWVRYGNNEDFLFVKSIQLSQSEGAFGSLRALLRDVLASLDDVSDIKIESVVQSTNAPSLSLHERLGFKKIKKGPKATRYSIDSADLRSNIRRLFRAD